MTFCFLFGPHLHVSLTDTHSLSCNVIIKTHTTPGHPWCEGHCSMDRESFLQYDNDNKATPLGDLGKTAHATHMWTDFVQELEYLWQELRKMLANTNLRKTKIRGHPTLQTIMLSQLEQGQIVGASWRFNISGKYFFILNTMNMSWIPISLDARGIMNEWKDDEDLTMNLKTFIANFRPWFNDLLKLPWERTRSTSRAPDTNQLPSAAQHPSTSQFHNEKVFIPVAAVIVIIFLLTIGILVKCCPQVDRNLQLPMNCSINCYKPQRKERPVEPSGEFPNQATKMLSQEDEPKT
ncbi:retinoic acid early transcript 1E [Peromyscus eremicus]|uniref:retinoic acid early transcript 1E n=1 Tax=Peromyscus eremicus TaxID=42410 RepID=UPI0027DD6BE4|nr:retinoic acid early transcript 1E [Peromyscus eremicus]